jgi:hypothetical protein
VTFSYTQISQYLRCPRSYRFRYLDGWREKESRAALYFGRCFEKALAAFFEHKDAGAVLFKEWGTCRDVPFEYSHGDDWERRFLKSEPRTEAADSKLGRPFQNYAQATAPQSRNKFYQLTGGDQFGRLCYLKSLLSERKGGNMKEEKKAVNERATGVQRPGFHSGKKHPTVEK